MESENDVPNWNDTATSKKATAISVFCAFLTSLLAIACELHFQCGRNTEKMAKCQKQINSINLKNESI